MPIKTENLVRAAAVSIATAGAIFVAVQINHPPMDAALCDDHRLAHPQHRRKPPWPLSPWQG